MTNFIFKSHGDLQKISQQLKIILDNQRHLRNDIAIQQGIIMKIFNALALQKQVDDYHEDHDVPSPRMETDDLD